MVCFAKKWRGHGPPRPPRWRGPWEGLKALVDQIPYIKGRYTINVEKLKRNISTNKLFCDNLAIKIGSKMIEQMGENSVTRVGISLAAMTYDAFEKIESSQVGDEDKNNMSE